MTRANQNSQIRPSKDLPITASTEPHESTIERDSCELAFHVARSVDDVIRAWQLVYSAYTRSGLIPENPYGLHTCRQAIDNESAVFLGQIRGEVASTMTAYLDGPAGLPLDAVYSEELRELRDDGRRLIEYGLFADRRPYIERTLRSLLELMRYVCHFGLHLGTTDVLAGVHPHHAAFYMRLFGFEQLAGVRQYEHVNGAEVVLLRFDWLADRTQERTPRGLAYLLDTPVDAATFNQRVPLNSQSISGSPIESFFEHRAGAAPAGGDRP